MIYLLKGEGKGKTTASTGMLIRALGHGWDVAMVTFFKGDDGYERGIHNLLTKELNVPIKNYIPEHPMFADKKVSAKDITNSALDGIRNSLSSYDLVVLDEINNVLGYNYIDKDKFYAVIDNSDKHIVCTGRKPPEGLIERADMISNVQNVRHHLEDGHKAKEGIEY